MLPTPIDLLLSLNNPHLLWEAGQFLASIAPLLDQMRFVNPATRYSIKPGTDLADVRAMVLTVFKDLAFFGILREAEEKAAPQFTRLRKSDQGTRLPYRPNSRPPAYTAVFAVSASEGLQSAAEKLDEYRSIAAEMLKALQFLRTSGPSKHRSRKKEKRFLQTLLRFTEQVQGASDVASRRDQLFVSLVGDAGRLLTEPEVDQLRELAEEQEGLLVAAQDECDNLSSAISDAPMLHEFLVEHCTLDL